VDESRRLRGPEEHNPHAFDPRGFGIEEIEARETHHHRTDKDDKVDRTGQDRVTYTPLVFVGEIEIKPQSLPEALDVTPGNGQKIGKAFVLVAKEEEIEPDPHRCHEEIGRHKVIVTQGGHEILGFKLRPLGGDGRIMDIDPGKDQHHTGNGKGPVKEPQGPAPDKDPLVKTWFYPG